MTLEQPRTLCYDTLSALILYDIHLAISLSRKKAKEKCAGAALQLFHRDQDIKKRVYKALSPDLWLQ